MNRTQLAADKCARRWGRHCRVFARERSLRSASILLAVGLAAALQSPSDAQQVSYLGAWKFVSGVPAPWAPSPNKVDAAEAKALIGKTVIFEAKAITGPKTFACKAPHYKLSNFSADMLFEGQFGEMHDADHSKDPLQLAHSLGFTGTSFKTLETGCEIDWHFVDPRTAEIGLDNFIFTLKKQ